MCELSYPKPNFLESGGPKSNQAEPMHRGIMQKKRHSYIKMTTGKKYCQSWETLEPVYLLHVFIFLVL